MGITSLLLMTYVLLLIMIILFITLMLRIKKIEDKLLNFSPAEAYTIMQTMTDMVKESERVADKLDMSIKEKEAILEDVIDLIDSKIVRFDNIVSKSSNEKGIRHSIMDLHEQGATSAAIAKQLGISLTEVQITLNIINRK